MHCRFCFIETRALDEERQLGCFTFLALGLEHSLTTLGLGYVLYLAAWVGNKRCVRAQRISAHLNCSLYTCSIIYLLSVITTITYLFLRETLVSTDKSASRKRR
ncbi:hypothetical protein GGS20DRAFT_34102 [Poronia punctata]|nr:hypothetical protein GGS20DRAFT_34102 [Poronia punctata]